MRYRYSGIHLRLFILMLILLLNGCSHTRKDGPPNYNVDVSSISDAVPRSEALSKYGNYKSYVVLGKRYYTLKNSRNYDEVGIASWYGTKFHARKTSSGERYNMLSMTAAHKTLPLPTYVEVTNLKNHRKIIVKVNDRGPFAPNRIIDLSYVGAKKLGMLGHGTAVVRVKAINPDTFKDSQPFFAGISHKKSRSVFAYNHPHEKNYPLFQPNSHSSKTVFLQVGAFRNKHYALRLQQRLNLLVSRKTPVNIIHPTVKGKLYTVKIGPIQDVASIAKITHQLKGLGIVPTRI